MTATDLQQRLAALSPEKRRLAELRLREKLHGGAFTLVSAEDRSRLSDGLEDAYPLAMLQLGMIYHMERTLDDPVPAYHNVNSFHVEAPFDQDAIQAAVSTVVARHATLRTTFHLEGFSEPLQLVHRSVEVPVQVDDLRHLARREQQEYLDEFFAAENRRIFDLTQPPLLRIHVHLRAERRFQFTLTEPHVISEGWSTTSTLAEISDLYLSILRGEPLLQPARPPLPYREFIRLEREALRSAEAREFWQESLAGWTATRLARWPAGFRPAERLQNRKPSWELPPHLLDGLQKLARSAGVPIKSVLLAAHCKFLSLWSGDSRVSTGLEFHGRPETREGDQVRGVFINTLPVRLELAASSWLDLARRAFDAETEILPFRRYPLAALQEGREGPLFEVSFTYLHFHGVDRVFQSEEMTLYRRGISDLSVSNFPLAVTFHKAEGTANVLALVLEHDDREFPLQQIRSFQSSFEQVLEAMARRPTARHDQVSLLAPEDRQQILQEWNDTAFEPAGELLIHRRIERWARETPEAPAAVDGARSLSYGELDRHAMTLAGRLRRLGVRADTLVGLCVERSCALATGILGILKAGGAYVPLDPAYPAERLRLLLEGCGASLVVTGSSSTQLAAAAGVQVVSLEELAASPSEPAEPDPALELAPDHLAYVIFTSGSTGRPKGVMATHRGLAASTQARSLFYRAPVTGYLLLSSFSFDSSVAGIFWTLCDGGTLILPPAGAERDPQEIARLAAERKPSHLLALPSLYSLLLDEDGGAPFSSLRTVIVAGEACPADLPAKHVQTLPGTGLFNEYGPTEGTVWCSVWDAAAPLRGERVPIGRPIPGARLYVLDHGLQPVPAGSPGEVWLGGIGLTRGYLHEPGLTAERFLPDPLAVPRGARMYRTGDLGRWLPDGQLEFLGRRDHQVKIRGFRIEVEEIEAVLAQHPAVREAAVAIRQEAGHPRLAAFVVGAEGVSPTDRELRTFLRQRLPDHMVPGSFVVLDALPLNPNGKLERSALLALRGNRPELDREYTAPRDEIERTLAAIWQEMLQVDRVGIHDSFFDLGGSSLLLIQLHRRQREVLGAPLKLADLFQNPTIAGLAEVVRRGEAGEESLQQGQERANARRAAEQTRARRGELRRVAKKS